MSHTAVLGLSKLTMLRIQACTLTEHTNAAGAKSPMAYELAGW